MRRLFSSPMLVALAALLLAAWTGLSMAPYTFNADASEMSVEGGSTLHDWSCPIKTMEGSLQMEPADTSATPIKSIKRVQVKVPVDAIVCEKDKMNNKLREALQMEKYPQVYFTLKDAQLSPLPDSGDGWAAVDATGELMVAGERRTIDLPVKAQRLDDGEFRFVGNHKITLSDYNMERPSVMFGTIKVSEAVTVNFDVVATPSTN